MRLVVSATFAAIAIAVSTASAAPEPKPTTYEGCVEKGAYVIEPYKLRLVDREQHPVDAKGLEGMRVWVRGVLLLDEKTMVIHQAPRVLGECGLNN